MKCCACLSPIKSIRLDLLGSYVLGPCYRRMQSSAQRNLTRFVCGAKKRRVKVITANPSSPFGTPKVIAHLPITDG